MRPSVIDLFAGAGGLSLGFHAAGCRIHAVVDHDAIAAHTFRQNFARLQADELPAVFGGEDEGNLERLELAGIDGGRPPDILIGGPPCQGFSRLGRAKISSLNPDRDGQDPRNVLYRTFLDAAAFWRPLAVVMENVPGMLSVNSRNVAAEAGADLAALGYRVGYAVLNAVWYGSRSSESDCSSWPSETTSKSGPPCRARRTGPSCRPATSAPHRPKRTCCPSWPPGCGWISTSLSLPATTVSDALDDLPVLADHLSGTGGPVRGDFRRTLRYRGPAHSAYARLMRAWPGLPIPEAIEDHVVRRTPRDYETFRRMRHGDRYPQAIAIARQRLNEEIERLGAAGLAPEPGSEWERELARQFVPPYPEEVFVDKWRKLIPDQPSWTIPAHLSRDTYSHIHHDSEQARMISPREAARLQSFPDSFTFAGNMGDCYRQIGNAVPPLLAWAIASRLLELLGLESRSPGPLLAG